MGGVRSTNGEEKKNAYRLLVGIPEGKGPLGRRRLRWVDNIKMNFGEMGWEVCTALVWIRISTSGELLWIR
jgi:hypothetical protein